MANRVLVHPFSPQGIAEPYPTLAAFRRISPAFFDRGMNLWLLTSHALCRAALRDPAFSAAAGQEQRLRDDSLPVSMLNTDGDLHVRLRSPATAAFAARSTGRLAAGMHAAAVEAIDALPGRGTGRPVEVMKEMAGPYAQAVLATMLGLPRAAWPEFGTLARAASVNLNPTVRGEEGVRAAASSAALNAFLLVHSSRLREADPPADLAGLPVDSGLSLPERLGIFSLTVIGGYEPLAIGVGTLLHLLLERPALLQAVRDGGRALLDRAVDEALRFESPIPFTARVCAAGYSGHGADLPPGAMVLALLGAANRDPEVFVDPDRFDPGRSPNPHLALGGGPHFCLGAPLVRQAMATMLEVLLTERPDVRPDPDAPARWRPTLIPRGLQTLPVLW